jgi:hypothetical protein
MCIFGGILNEYYIYQFSCYSIRHLSLPLPLPVPLPLDLSYSLYLFIYPTVSLPIVPFLPLPASITFSPFLPLRLCQLGSCVVSEQAESDGS